MPDPPPSPPDDSWSIPVERKRKQGKRDAWDWWPRLMMLFIAVALAGAAGVLIALALDMDVDIDQIGTQGDSASIDNESGPTTTDPALGGPVAPVAGLCESLVDLAGPIDWSVETFDSSGGTFAEGIVTSTSCMLRGPQYLLWDGVGAGLHDTTNKVSFPGIQVIVTTLDTIQSAEAAFTAWPAWDQTIDAYARPASHGIYQVEFHPQSGTWDYPGQLVEERSSLVVGGCDYPIDECRALTSSLPTVLQEIAWDTETVVTKVLEYGSDGSLITEGHEHRGALYGRPLEVAAMLGRIGDTVIYIFASGSPPNWDTPVFGTETPTRRIFDYLTNLVTLAPKTGS